MSSASNKYISNKEAVPVLPDSVFGDNHNSDRFAIKVVSPEDLMRCEEGSIAEAYLKLRANVYIDQTGMLDIGEKKINGTESDLDDERSTHIVMLENRLGEMALFACMRIIKKENGLKLPIEEFFPESFDVPASQDSAEVSRFIVRLDDRRQARLAKVTLMAAGLAQYYLQNLEPILAVVEPSFERDLKFVAPVERISELKEVEAYNDQNVGIIIDKVGFREKLGDSMVNDLMLGTDECYYWGEIKK